MDRNLFLFILCCLFFSMQVDSSPCREAVNGKRKVFLSWEQAVLKVRRAGVSTVREYRSWQKRHPDMPSNPASVYGKQWQNWRHFLGTFDIVKAIKEGKVLKDLMGLDFSGLDLRWRDFSGKDLTGATFLGTDLRWANFEGANLTEANFQFAILTGANLRKTNLEDAIFFQAHLLNTDLRGAKMSDKLREYARSQGAILD